MVAKYSGPPETDFGQYRPRQGQWHWCRGRGWGPGWILATGNNNNTLNYFVYHQRGVESGLMAHNPEIALTFITAGMGKQKRLAWWNFTSRSDEGSRCYTTLNHCQDQTRLNLKFLLFFHNYAEDEQRSHFCLIFSDLSDLNSRLYNEWKS